MGYLPPLPPLYPPAAIGSPSMEWECNNNSHEVGKRFGNGQPKLCSRGHWRPAEDAKLRELVALCGPQNWNLIAEKLEGRSGKSCRLRWFNQLDPRINKRPFNEEEEEKLLAAHRLYGNKWALIARLFPGRTDNTVKNHWHVITVRKYRLQHQKEKQPSTPYRRRKSSSSSSSSSSTSFPSHVVPNNNSFACSGQSTSTSTIIEPAASASSRDALQPQLFHFLTGSGDDKKVVDYRNGSHPMLLVMGSDHSGYSNSNSEVSAAESPENTMRKSTGYGEMKLDREKMSFPFIDFLGVGTA